MDKIELHKQICDSLNKLYKDKNHDYGDSVHDTFEKYGLTSFLVRMEDKLNRARTLDRIEGKVKDEKIEDTLLDLANYIEGLESTLIIMNDKLVEIKKLLGEENV